MSPGMVLLLFAAYLWIFVLGLVGNIMVMVVVLTRYTDKKEKKISEYFPTLIKKKRKFSLYIRKFRSGAVAKSYM
jgi:hypothetical protein